MARMQYLYDGIRFRSWTEVNRYKELASMQRDGRISDLCVNAAMEVTSGAGVFQKVVIHISFIYKRTDDGKTIYETRRSADWNKRRLMDVARCVIYEKHKIVIDYIPLQEPGSRAAKKKEAMMYLI